MIEPIVIGHDYDHLPVYWPMSCNLHMAVYGLSGSGKTTFVRKLISELPDKGARVIILGCREDYITKPPSRQPNQIDSIVDAGDADFSVGLFSFEESYNNQKYTTKHAQDVVSLLKECIPCINDSQGFSLENVLFDYLITKPNNDLRLSEFLQWIDSRSQRRKDLGSTYNILSVLNRITTCGSEAYAWPLDTPGISYWSSCCRENTLHHQIVTELALNDIIKQRKKSANTSSPVILVIDECQHYRFHSGSKLDYLVREGRKLGIFCWFCTQWPRSKTSKDDMRQLLAQAGMQVYFPLDPKQIKVVARDYSNGDKNYQADYEIALSTLTVGHCLIHSPQGTPMIIQT